MGIDIGRARRALRSAGGRSSGLYWPFGRERRARLLLRSRLAILEAKNAVAGFLYSTQRPLADLQLDTLADVERVLADPQRRKLVVGRTVSREVIEEELRRKAGSELGRALDQALSELIAEGFVLQLPGKQVLMREDVYLAVLSRPQPKYEVSELNRLVREGSGYAAQLRTRARRDEATTGRRSYSL
ncbi:MAG: hypothetical protein ACE149_07675 [Armatimonadota bacterium]